MKLSGVLESGSQYWLFKMADYKKKKCIEYYKISPCNGMMGLLFYWRRSILRYKGMKGHLFITLVWSWLLISVKFLFSHCIYSGWRRKHIYKTSIWWRLESTSAEMKKKAKIKTIVHMFVGIITSFRSWCPPAFKLLSDPVNLQGISNWTLYLFYGVGMFSFHWSCLEISRLIHP